jgi:hypothetical protein
MRVAAVLLAVCLSVRAAVSDEFPYRAEITQEAALVRSGPGESHYPTCRLLRGAEVEVYRQAPNGWCAIRPPEGEFSLVAADQVRLLPGDDLAEVVAAEAPVWVGSESAKPDQHTWQIHLQRGERAVVLGVRTAPGEKDSTVTWYKIAPPAGEFRWVPAESLAPVQAAGALGSPSTPKVETQVPNQDTANQGPGLVLEEAKANDEAPEPREATPPAGPLSSPAEVANAVKQASLELPIAGDAVALAEPATSTASAFLEADRRVESLPRVVRLEPNAEDAPIQPGAVANEPFDVQFTAIQVDLTLAVAQDLSRWRLGPLRDRAMQLRDSAATAADRERTESLLASIAGFEQLYRRYCQYAQARSSPAPRVVRQAPPDSGGMGSFFRQAATPQ